MTVQIVWHKRDLRTADNAVLAAAAQHGPVLPIYVVEPEYWQLPDTSYRQFRFLRGSLADLQDQYSALCGKLHIRVGDVVSTLKALKEKYSDIRLWAHQETGNFWTYKRDLAVKKWCRENAVVFTESKQFGIWRGAEINRDKWAKMWDAFMATPQYTLPPHIQWIKGDDQALPQPQDLGLADDGIKAMQETGRAAAQNVLDSFLFQRGQNYRTDMSSPILGEDGCSRLSPYIAMGTLSMREIYQTTLARQDALADHNDSAAKAWKASLRSFVGRLHWHCHFMQKLELEPELEWLPMARSYSNIRADYEPSHLVAFENGATGFPFIDACIRYLRRTGWINFRMRAMLTSFASYNLWLPWQKSGDVLARLFVDYEPGIHWTQSQMQSGETGINTLRIYSPVKQGYDQDPKGDFVRANVPELADMAGGAVHEPWLFGGAAGYPDRMVDHVISAKEARARIWAIKRTSEAKAEATLVYEKHGSRKRPRRRQKTAAKSNSL